MIPVVSVMVIGILMAMVTGRVVASGGVGEGCCN